MQAKKILPPTYFMVSIAAIIVIHFLLPVMKLIYFPWILLGFLPLAASGILNLLADRDLKRADTTVKPFENSSALLTTGVYRITRNPMYLGMTLFLAGESILLGTLSPFIITLIFLLIMEFNFIHVEEKMLSKKFDESYSEYKQKVRRWI